MIKVVENNNNYRRLKKALFGDPSNKIKTFAIISPENPLGWADSSEEEFKVKYAKWTGNPQKYNKEALDELKSSLIKDKIKNNGEKCLKYGNFNYVKIKGSYGDKENTLMIFNIPFADAKTIAKSFGQESFFYGIVGEEKSKIAYYKTDNSCITYKLIDITDTVTYENDAEDFFSKFGFKYKINMKEFGDNVDSINNDGEFEESMNENRTFLSRAEHRKIAYKGETK